MGRVLAQTCKSMWKAIGLGGADGKIMSQTVKYCIVFGIIVCVLSYVSAVLI